MKRNHTHFTPTIFYTDDFDGDIFFRGTYVISGGPPPEIAPETALPTTPSKLGINHERRSGTDQRSPEQRKI